jgi:hypothetical protein
MKTDDDYRVQLFGNQEELYPYVAAFQPFTVLPKWAILYIVYGV